METLIQALLCGPEGFDFVIDYHTRSICQVSSCGPAVGKEQKKKERREKVKYALVSITAREAGQDGAQSLSTFSRYVM